ncbi:MAG: DNA polymerase Y family protein [Gammaproteobacteria bacterium]|nr:DNA polymerase Y family protein [Gammaproteobacteria bacterium]MDD9894889.1 DNA polymerase Y family protein [Gammaproteobacteria bacterium]MDD9958856.1 DNA polymerase Y family protein [Gammaproteobacteria bacterium]
MEDPESTVQLPLPSPFGAKAEVIELPLPGQPASESKQDSTQFQAKKPDNLWYAVYFPQLAQLTESQQQEHLKELAAVLESISSTVSFHPQALICEIRSSLKYFGGINAIHNKVNEPLKEALKQLSLPEFFLHAACPTVTGSLLLARSGHNGLVYRKDNLRSALGQLSTEVLHLSKEQNRRLYNMGIRHLRDIWRLPTDGLRKRFGSEFMNLLKKALGEAPDPTQNYLPPPAFSTSYDLPYEVESLDRLLPIADEMLSHLCEFLRRRDLSMSHLVFYLKHEKRNGTDINMSLRQASRCNKHLLMLLETHFTNLMIPAPVIAMKMEVKKFDAFMSHSESLLAEDKPNGRQYHDNNLYQFMEQLKARLGGHFVNSINTVAEHCPEYATRQIAYDEMEITSRAGDKQKSIPLTPRPFLLLQEPQQLILKNGKLYHSKPITIISGPERIESYWWSGSDVRRDYYVALEQNGSRLWIYRERSGEKNWYLHGYFA